MLPGADELKTPAAKHKIAAGKADFRNFGAAQARKFNAHVAMLISPFPERLSNTHSWLLQPESAPLFLR
jgi:hypothetical protein